jgi:hypothetical protein
MADPNTVQAEVERLTRDMCQWYNYAAASVPYFQGEAQYYYNQQKFVANGWEDQGALLHWDNGNFHGKSQ